MVLKKFNIEKKNFFLFKEKAYSWRVNILKIIYRNMSKLHLNLRTSVDDICYKKVP